MKNQSRFTILILFFAFILPLFQAPLAYAQSKVDQIDELVSKYNEYDKFHGSVLVADNGKVIYKKGFGMANREWDIPNAADTKHRLGSITKQFTGMLILQLAAEGKVRSSGSNNQLSP